jgi:hypothetical protein
MSDWFLKLLDVVGDMIEWIVSTILEWIVTWLADIITFFMKPALRFALYVPVPRPKNAFLIGKPINPPWPTMYEAYWATMVPFSLFILVVTYIGTNALGSWGLGPAAKRSKTRRGLILGIIAIPLSWYLAAAYLRVNFLAMMWIAPDISQIGDVFVSAAEDKITSSIGVMLIFILVWCFALTTYSMLFLLHGVRIIGTIVILYAMPLLLAFEFARVPYFKGMSKKIIRQFPKLVLMPLPTAIGLRASVFFLDKGNGFIFALPFGKVLSPIIMIAPAFMGIFAPILVIKKTEWGQGMATMSSMGMGWNEIVSQNFSKGPEAFFGMKEGWEQTKQQMEGASLDEPDEERRRQAANQQRQQGGPSGGSGGMQANPGTARDPSRGTTGRSTPGGRRVPSGARRNRPDRPSGSEDADE